MEVSIRGKGTVSLHRNDFKAAGGEGTVFIKGQTAYKLYGAYGPNDTFSAVAQKMIPLGKIQELAPLSEPYIIKPEEVLLDANGTAIGYTMRAIPDAIPLCKVFPRAFRDRNHLTNDQIVRMVQRIQAGIVHVHAQKILIVDMNEFNFLIAPTFDDIYFIDVDSYQTAHFPASAIMATVRDRHSQGFNEGTDWFAFALLSFQLFMGIHPYKGMHPRLATLDDRMLANVSVLHAGVEMPPVCPPLSVIPTAYLDWYRAVLERGARIAPPDSPYATVTIIHNPIVKHVAGSQLFQIDLERAYDSNVVFAIWPNVLTTEGVWTAAHRIGSTMPGAILGVTPREGLPLLAYVENRLLVVSDVSRGAIYTLATVADEVMSSAGRIYFRNGDLLQELDITELPNKLILGTKVIGTVRAQSTQLYEGVAIQTLLAATYAGLLTESGQFREIRLKELDPYRIVDAKYEGRVLVVIGSIQGRYDRFVFRFSENFSAYDIRTTSDVPMIGINFTTLDTGIVLLMNEKGDLELFSNKRGSASVRTMSDPSVGADCRLFHHGAQAMFARGDALYRISMKP